LKVFFPISAVSFLLGVAYGLWNVAVHGKIPMGSALLIQLAVVVFLFGLISEQIASGQDRAECCGARGATRGSSPCRPSSPCWPTRRPGPRIASSVPGTAP